MTDRPSIPRTPPSPRDEAELCRRARDLAGHTLAEVGRAHGWSIPEDLRRHKGWIGQLLEHVLGARASSRALPDFPHLHVELKTLPVDPRGRPAESTYVCTLPLDGSLAPTWDQSWVCQKLARVLWVPIVAEKGTPPGDRVVGTPILWTPDPDQAAALRADWEAVAELVALGELWHLTAHHGQVLQVRPKGATSADRTLAVAADGDLVEALPRGFYLRPSFTGDLLARALRTI